MQMTALNSGIQSLNGSAITKRDECVLVTGAGGFIGSKVVKTLLDHGFTNIRCFARSSIDLAKPTDTRINGAEARVEVFNGDLLSKEDCLRATKNVSVIYHLAAGRGTKSIPDAFLNSVVTTRNLLEAAGRHGCVKRFVNISSLSVYTNVDKTEGSLLDESCPVETRPQRRGDAYCFAKTKQDEIVAEYGKRLRIPFVIIRPGVVYGPGNHAIHGRVGIGTFGVFLHLGGANPIPLTYVDNCAEAIVLAGLVPGVDGQVFNVVDDNLPSSRQFLHLYKKNVKRFRSLYVPRAASYFLCWMWEKYAAWSEDQLPPTFNCAAWHGYWKKTRFTNAKAKQQLGWKPRVAITEGLGRYFESCKQKLNHG